LETYKGFRITSTDPLTIESYSDLYYADAELDVVTGWPTSPTGLAGENAWEMLAISNLAEIEGEVAYSFDKAGLRQIEQTNWIGGWLEIPAHLDKTLKAGDPVPADPGQYITAEQAGARHENLRAWHYDHGHFWVGTGPYYSTRLR
jgi:peptide/nickel transport system substrate-binding protein